MLVILLVGPVCALLAPVGDRPKGDDNLEALHGSRPQRLLAPAGDRPKGDRLATPVQVEVDGKPLVSERGGLLPFVGDFYGDGRLALLLGYGGDTMYVEGRLLVYHNVGTKVSPRLGAPQWFDDTVPTGRIPQGTG
jgi:hypothetical protein